MTDYNIETIQKLNYASSMDYEDFKYEFEKLTGICLNLYKEKQMKRRINTLIERKGFDGYQSFLSLLRTDPYELAGFVDYITINVTEFFRTPEQWSYMENKAMSELINGTRGKLKIWSTACSTGEEPYSLAMSLLQKAETSSGFQILATDIDEKVLRFAKKGIYRAKNMENIPTKLKERFFVPDGTDWKVSEELRACVEFRKLDLLKEPYPTDCDLIVCRNVLIYFTEEAKEQIYWKFTHSLNKGGWLFTGNTEQLIYYKKYGLKKEKSFLYKNE